MADPNAKAFAEIKRWQRLMREAPALIERMSKDMAACTLVLIDKGFEEQRDPYGDRWTPKQRPNGRPILIGRTLRLRRGWHIVKQGREGFTVAPSVDYAAAHQEPRRIGRRRRTRPQRMMVPSRSRGLPRAWRAAYVDAVGKTVLRAWKR